MLAQRDVEAARDNYRGAEPGPAVRKFLEEEPAEKRGTDQLNVAHGRDHGGTPPLEGLDDEEMAEQAPEPEAGEQGCVHGAARELERVEGQEERGQQQSAETGEGDGCIGRILPADLASQHLVEAVAERIDQHQHGTPLHHRRAGADDDECAQEAHQDGGPAPGADLLAQDGHEKAVTKIGPAKEMAAAVGRSMVRRPRK